MTAYMDHKDLSNTVISEERRQQIRQGVESTLERMYGAIDKSGRLRSDVSLLAATKTRDVGEIVSAVDSGIRCIGENRPQEIVAKAEGLETAFAERGLSIPFHMIGQLQSNKISKIVPYVSTIESIDSLKLAERIARRLEEGQTIGVFLEVNESGEASKSGCKPEEAYDLALRIAQIPQLKLEGLMTIGTHVDDEKTVRACFAHLRGLREDLQSAGPKDCKELSMGMSSDMEWAIAEGSTIIRIGTAIFGERAFI
ncbi:YggS family pyridoxal phosphate-dependent enzyme [Alloscardovia criceti]|uniref:YggS family pyridoxal phosphate-dependent enzyme n=1 Tax=Alloscardovia criceti TaxID=356828 RepID=UPI00037A2C74|nr:YggS family pyridoxal phosphate-dependent enzyme [Alloscardovia criceti]